jgi:multidrug efflux pump subunit AcrA (membrane-fusion protein)
VILTNTELAEAIAAAFSAAKEIPSANKGLIDLYTSQLTALLNEQLKRAVGADDEAAVEPQQVVAEEAANARRQEALAGLQRNFLFICDTADARIHNARSLHEARVLESIRDAAGRGVDLIALLPEFQPDIKK